MTATPTPIDRRRSLEDRVSSRLRRRAFILKSGVIKPADVAALRQFRRDELADPEQVALDQTRRALDVARHAFTSTVFYRELYSRAGFELGDFDNPSTFAQLPTVSRSHLRESRSEFIAGGIPEHRRIPSSTGGSTGIPLTLFHDRSSPVAAMWWRVFEWWGVSPWDNRAVIQRERRSRAVQVREQLEWWPTIQFSLDARSMTDDSIAAFIGKWNRHRPRLLNGYVGGVAEFASAIEKLDSPLLAPRAIAVTAAPITDSQRRHIQGVIGAPVFDSYRSAEVPWIAAECEAHSGLHVLADSRMVEILDDADRSVEPNQTGDVVITDFSNRVFPLVRYRIGDRTNAIPGRCACGRSFPLLAPIQGRVSDVLRLPNGQRIAGGLTGLFNARPDAVRQFQVHQLEDYSIVLRYVPADDPTSAEAVHDAASQLSRIVDFAVPVTVEAVPRIHHDSGKVRVIKSDVASREPT